MTRTWLTWIVCLSSTLLLANRCVPTPIEQALGKGWNCYVIGDEAKKAGVVFLVDPDGTAYIDADYSDKSQEGEEAIGSAVVTYQATLGGVVKLLQDKGALSQNDNVTGDLTRTVTVNTSYGGTKHHFILGDVEGLVAADYAKKNRAAGSTYTILRETVSATSADISIDDSLAASVGLDATLKKAVSAKVGVSFNSDNKYHLSQTFAKPLGVCALSRELQIDRSAEVPVLMQGEALRLPDTKAIVSDKVQMR